MKMIVENSSMGIEKLLGERVTFFCMNYIYVGKLLAVDEREAILTDCSIVYETGAFSDDGFKDAQLIAPEWVINRASIESYGRIPKK